MLLSIFELHSTLSLTTLHLPRSIVL